MKKNTVRKDLTDSFVLYNSAEVMEILQISRTTLHNYIKSGKIAGSKVGGIWRFSKDDIMSCLQHQKANPDGV